EQPGSISGETGWQIQSHYVDAGNHTLTWVYTNRTATVSLTNGVWVDQVSFTPGSIAPTIYDEPVDVVALQGSTAIFRVMAGGTPPLSYQWFRNGVSLGSAATNATLTVFNVAQALAGSYSVQVSNPLQTVMSTNAILTVLPIPPANDDFANRTPLTGTNAVPGYTFGATKEANEPNHALNPGGR